MDYKTNSRVVRAMVDRLVLAATGQPDLAKAWGSLVSPNDKIGIKISAAGGELVHDPSRHRERHRRWPGRGRPCAQQHHRLGPLARRNQGRRLQVGADGFQLKSIAPRDWLRSESEFHRAVARQTHLGRPRLHQRQGKERAALRHRKHQQRQSFSQNRVTDVTKIINVPVMSNSTTNGIAGCLYNMTIPNIDNWRRFAQGTPFGAESIAKIYANPSFRRKLSSTSWMD